MKTLKDFAKYLREVRLKDYVTYYLTVIKGMDIPIVKLVIEKGLVKDIAEENSVKTTMDSQKNFLQSLEGGTTLANTKVSMIMWEEDKLPGISKHEILPSDIVLLFAAQKKALFNFLPDYINDIRESVAIVQEIEDLYTQMQKDASQMLFKIHAGIETQLKDAEEQFRLIVYGVKDYAIYMIDINGNITSWNKGAERIKGYKEEEITGKNISLFYIEEDRKKNVPAYNLDMALKQGRHEAEGWRVRKDRSIFWADEVITAVYDNNGIHKGFSKIVRDLTARKKNEEEIKRNNDFLDSVLDNIPNMVFVKDAGKLKFVRFNKAGEKLLGYSRKELIGKSDYELFPKDQADFFTANDRKVLASDDVADISQEQVDTKYGTRWLHTRKMAVKDDTGKPLYLLGISEDITAKREVDEQIKKLNRELAQNVRQLETANKELESFSYSVSHDLRAPLRAIQSYTRILTEDYAASLGDDARHMLGAVESNGKRMGQLIDDLLAFARMGKKEINHSETNMTELANTALNEIRAAYGDTYKANVTVHELLPANVDRSLMLNVFTNFISNAVKYSSKSLNPEVEIGSYTGNGENIYFFKDNGVGFDMKYYNKLFGVFQRLHSNAEFEGTGVGLALVRRIVTRHGGRVWAEAEPGKGATFYMSVHV